MRASRENDDEAALREVVYDYADLLDRNAADEWLDLFAAEARYRVIQRKNYELGLPLYLINENRERLQHRIHGYRGEAMPPTLHVVANVRCTRTSDRDAEARANVLVLRRGELVFSGRYQMEMVKESSVWRIGECLLVLEGESVPENIQLPI
jgi:3-phenylpropionate/cinnamic acid dioxygenase small subunit